MVDVLKQHIEIVEGEGGPKARIAGHRIRVQDIAIWHEKLGMSPDEIVFRYPDRMFTPRLRTTGTIETTSKRRLPAMMLLSKSCGAPLPVFLKKS